MEEARPDRVSWGDQEVRFQESLNGVVLGSLRPISLALSLLYAVFAVGHVQLLPWETGRVMAPLAMATSVLLLVLAWGVTHRLPHPRLAHPLGVVIATLVLGNSLLHLSLTQDPVQTTNLLLLILGLGVLFLDGAWFAVVTAGAFTGWALVVSRARPDPQWIHFGFALLGASVLASAVLVIRVRAYRRMEELRFNDRVRQLELESALTRTESALQGEEEARLALEGAVDQLRESEERFRRLADATSEGVLIHQDGRVVDSNRRAADLFSMEAGSLQGRRLQDLFREVAPSSGDVDETDEVGLRPDGSSFPVERATLAASYGNRPAQVTAFRDVTDRREVERVLRRAVEEAEANSRAKSAFLANMSHELRTPLNAIIGFANLLGKNRHGTLPERELDFLNRISSNGEHLLMLINEILDLSKIEAQRMELELEPVDLAETVSGVVQALEVQARRKGLTMEAHVPEGLPPTVADSRRLKQVLINLLGNALKFTHEGRIDVQVIAGTNPYRAVRIDVKDTGIGIPQDQLSRVFSPFQQVDSSQARAYGGTGLGLAISLSLCDLMGFQLVAHSREGEGSTFSILLEPQESGWEGV
ncbi:MAG: ATP-binding protein [Gemmatimonadota bacterium]